MPEINPIPDILVLPVGATTGARIVIDGTNDRIVVYNDNNQVTNIIAASAGTVSGVNYPAGFTGEANGNSQAFSGLTLLSGAPNEALPAAYGVEVNPSANAIEALLNGPANTEYEDYVSVFFISSQPSGPANANGQLTYTAPGTGLLPIAQWGDYYFQVLGTLKGNNGTLFIDDNVTMGNGKYITAVGWAAIPMDSGWSSVSGYPAPRYRPLPDGNVQLDGLAHYSTNFTSPTALNSGSPLPSAYRLAGYTAGAVVKGASPGPRAAVQVNATGVIYAVPQAGYSSYSYIDLSGIIYTIT